MISRLRPKLTYGNAIATIALFVALGGVAVAAGLPKNSVGKRQLKRGAVTTAKLAPKAVKVGKLGPSAVLPGNIVDGGITTSKIGTNAVIARSIKNGVITTNKLNNEAVTTAKLGKGSVTLAKLGDEVAPLLGTLKAGQTLRGVFDLGGKTEFDRSGVSFQFPLVNPPAAPEANILPSAGTSPACPGLKGGGGQTPEAAAGQLCVYIRASDGATPKLAFDAGTVSRLGFGLTAEFGAEETKNVIQGFWAVTAP
ncbi:MAG: hypothetical protein WBL45_03100 [Solirubrobacterales bacterium]